MLEIDLRYLVYLRFSTFFQRIIKISKFPLPDQINEQIQKLNNDYANGLARLRSHRHELTAKTKHLNAMQEQFGSFEQELDEIVRNRFESNDNLLKIHKELVDQNAKLERAKREARIAKKTMSKHVQNRDYIRIFEVSIAFLFIYFNKKAEKYQ